MLCGSKEHRRAKHRLPSSVTDTPVSMATTQPQKLHPGQAWECAGRPVIPATQLDRSLTAVEANHAAEVGVGGLPLDPQGVLVPHRRQVVVHDPEGSLRGVQPPAGQRGGEERTLHPVTRTGPARHGTSSVKPSIRQLISQRLQRVTFQAV